MSAPAGTDPNALMVGVSGLRGIVGGSLTPGVVARYATSWASMLGGKGGAGRTTIVVGRDGRAGGDAIERIAVGALKSAGVDVVRLGVAMTATVGVAVRELNAAGGLVVTASHNPAQWNGLKPITPEGSAPMPAVAKDLVARFHAASEPGGDPSAGVASAPTDRDATDRHVRRVLDALATVVPLDDIRARRVRVAVDSVNASGVRGAWVLLESLGCEITHLNREDTGVFPHAPEPIEENLQGLRAAVRDAGADVGFAQDPDADRLAIVDGEGTYIGEEYTLALCARSMLERMSPREADGATLCANLSTSRMIDDVASRFGARVVRTAVGEANVVDGMRRTDAVLGGEGNGGVIWPEVVQIRDSLVGMGLILALIANRGGGPGALIEAVNEIPRYAIVKRKMPFEPGMDTRFVERLRTAFPGARIDDQDGIRLDFEAPSKAGQAWVHARKSNTEPIFRLIVEAPTRDDAVAIADRAEKAGA